MSTVVIRGEWERTDLGPRFRSAVSFTVNRREQFFGEPAEDHGSEVRGAEASVDELVVAGHAFEHDCGELFEHRELEVLVGVREGCLADLVGLGCVFAYLSEE